MTRQSRNVKTFLQQNNNVPPLLLQKAMQLKLNTIKQNLKSDNSNYHQTKASLDELNTSFRNGIITMHTYNAGLDEIIEKINKTQPVM